MTKDHSAAPYGGAEKNTRAGAAVSRKTPRRPVSGRACVLAVLLAFVLGGYAGVLAARHYGGGAASAADGARLSEDMAARISHAEEHTRREPGKAEVWIELGNLCYDAHRHAEAIAAYERALALKPGDPDVLTDLGTMYLAEKQARKALECFDKAIAANPAHQNSQLNKGFALLDLGRKEEARATWQKLLRLNPKMTLGDGTPLTRLVRDLPQP